MNGNGQEKYKHWKILNNFGDQFRIENPPIGSDPLPLGVPEFNGYTSCFATSYYECTKVQEILLKNKLLLRYIMDKFMPHIYISEWVAGRFDCGSRYKLGIRGCGEEYTKGDVFSLYGSDDSPEIIAEFQKSEEVFVEQWKGKEWKKVELLIEGYPCNVTTLLFEHEGQDTQFWKGHYGSKMAGGLIRFAFDSIELLEDTGETKSRRLFKKSDKQ
ncbi:F-box only protein 6 [Gonioctena quinquepunctata]|nr:F-box only protein 6 [Gonioctena quinquepunctata]